MTGAFLHLPSWEDSTLATELPDPSHFLGNLPLPCLSFYTKDLVLQSLPSFPVLPTTVDSFIFKYLQIRLQSTVSPNLPQTPLNLSASGPRISQNKVKLLYILRSSFLPSHACFDLQLFVLGFLPGKIFYFLFFFFSIYEHLNHTRYIVESTSDRDTSSTNLLVGCHLCTSLPRFWSRTKVFCIKALFEEEFWNERLRRRHSWGAPRRPPRGWGGQLRQAEVGRGRAEAARPG